MKYLLLLLLITGCEYPKRHVGIIHDYIIQEALAICKTHEGLHYIVQDETITSKNGKDGNMGDYPCSGVYKFRCQDGTIINRYSEVTWCFISESQLNETLEKK